MAERDQFAVSVGAQLEMVAGFGAIGRDGEALVARGHQLDGAADLLRRTRNDGGALGQRATRAESAARKRRHDMDVIRLDVQLPSQSILEAPNILAGFP